MVTLSGCVRTLRQDQNGDDRRLIGRLMPAQQCLGHGVDLIVVGAREQYDGFSRSLFSLGALESYSVFDLVLADIGEWDLTAIKP
jgi:hypothetical protein